MSNSLDNLSSDKRLVIGADEAGYGPNLGPLVIAASAWEIPKNFDEQTFCKNIAQLFHITPFAPGCSHVPLGDSKQLYSSSGGLTTLESGLLALLKASTGNLPQTLGQLIDQHAEVLLTASQPDTSHDSNLSGTPGPLIPWYAFLSSESKNDSSGTNSGNKDSGNKDSGSSVEVPKAADEYLKVPVAVPRDEALRLAELVKSSLGELGIKCLGIRAQIVSESSFNQHLEKMGSKGQLLSIQTLQLVSHMVSRFGNSRQAVEVFCDRQGGRKNYMPILLDVMPDRWFQEIGMSKERCSYRCDDENFAMDIHFSIGGDRFPPTALASMMAKYLRERLMGTFNDFWKTQFPDIKPTAGYPVDAKRFRSQIETRARELNLDAESWWRNK